MSTVALRPWTDIARLHPDVESGELTEAVFAIDLGAIAMNDPEVPVVYRDPSAFFRATYLTKDLGRLLDEVLATLSGKKGYNRVLKLRTPFGGGEIPYSGRITPCRQKQERSFGNSRGQGICRSWQGQRGRF